MRHYILIDDWHPTRLNRLLGHWARSARRKRQDAMQIALAKSLYGIPDATGKRRVTLTIVLGKGHRAADPDAYWKSLLDALVQAKLLINDNRQYVELMPVKFVRSDSKQTLIELEDVIQTREASMNHTLKTDPDAFEEVKAGRKTFEVRWNDRGFQVGDLLTLRKTLRTSYQNAPGVENPFTEDDPIVVEVTHAIYGPRYGIADGWACMSIKAIKLERPT